MENKTQDYQSEILAIIRGNTSPGVMRNKLEDYHENDLADVFSELTAAERRKVCRILNLDMLSDIFEYIDEKQAAEYLVGEHDFKSLCTQKPEVENTVRTIYSVNITKEDELIRIRICGNGFLYNMIRIIVGTLLRIGSGYYEPEYMKELLELKDRQAAGETAPPQGLTLVEIRYPEEE